MEQRIERHLASLLARPRTRAHAFHAPSQAPVFHGYSVSFWVEMEKRPPLPSLKECLASAHIEIRSAEFDAPQTLVSRVSVA